VRLSFLITYYDEGSWLAECLQSVLPQLGAEDEIVVYDDASERPAHEYLLRDARVRCVRGERNIGPARGRNELLRLSRGTHIHFHDADDLCAPDWRRRVAAAFAGDTDVVFTDVGSFDEQGGRWTHVMGVDRLERSGDLLAFALRGGLLAPAGTYRREVVTQVGGYRADLWQSEDYDFHVRLALSAPRWRVVAEDLVLIRRHAKQRSRDTAAVWTCAVDALEQNAAFFPARAHADVAAAATRAASHLFAAGAHEATVRAFMLAERFGGARYERGLMQRLTRMVGPLSAERMAALYRRLVPRALRRRIQGAGG
jgi:hypothetical protein